ncbi:MAG: H-NS histone family protein [Paraglaciecola sp.]|nr:H-NS histone family protein [Paraglaciecola sp.]NCT47209.1 H-NS histone family protein [Paraglaciecola sp.]
MTDFLAILTHGRRFQGAVKELSIAELETVQEKLGNIIEQRKSKEAEQKQFEAEKQAKRESILQQMREAGLEVSDLQPEGTSKTNKPVQKRPVKYKLTDAQGQEHLWTGIGRMPKVYAQAIASGKSLQNFAI